MHKFSFIIMLAVMSVILSGCPKSGGLTQLQDSISHFDQATHAAATAETTFLNAVLMADCDNQFYESSFCYSTWNEPKARGFRREKCGRWIIPSEHKPAILLRGYCTPSIITPEQIETRNALMNAIVLYADKMQALASSDNVKQLDDKSTTTAKKLNTLATTGGFKLNNALVTDVEAGVISIANMALDQKIYQDIQSAAIDMQKPLENVVNALKTENYGFGKAMKGAFDGIEIDLRTVLSFSHQPGKSTPAELFFSIINSRSILANADLVTKQSFTLSDKSSSIEAATSPDKASSVDTAKPLNDALDIIVSGNKAIAENKTGGIYAAANDLYKRAVAAKDLYSAITNGK